MTLKFVKNLNKRSNKPFWVAYEGDEWVGKILYCVNKYIIEAVVASNLQADELKRFRDKLNKLSKNYLVLNLKKGTSLDKFSNNKKICEILTDREPANLWTKDIRITVEIKQ